MYTRRLNVLGAAALLLATLGACAGTPGATDGKVHVVAAFYPLQYVTEQVGGDRVRVTNLVKPGAEPHDLELRPRQVAKLADADLVVYLRGFQPAVDDAVDQTDKGDRAFDVATVQPLRDGYVPLEAGRLDKDAEGRDPHVWLDPTRLAAIGAAVAARLAAIDPAHTADYRRGAAALTRKLTALDAEYRGGLKNCAQRTIVVSHNAFGYLAERYGLTQVSVTGLTPEEEPTAARLSAVARYARAHGVTVIFFETLVSPKVARALAAEIGARAEVLDPLEGLEDPGAEDYVTVMRSNLTTLRGALRCR